MNAQEARALTDHSLSEKGQFMQVETKYVLELIKDAAEKGLSSCVTKHIAEIIQFRLINLGYKVEYEKDALRSHDDYLIIKW